MKIRFEETQERVMSRNGREKSFLKGATESSVLTGFRDSQGQRRDIRSVCLRLLLILARTDPSKHWDKKPRNTGK